MYRDSVLQAIVAALTLIGTFTILTIYAAHHATPDPGIMTLLTAVMTGVAGWYFGARGAITSAQVSHQAAAETQAATVAYLQASGATLNSAPPGTVVTPPTL